VSIIHDLEGVLLVNYTFLVELTPFIGIIRFSYH